MSLHLSQDWLQKKILFVGGKGGVGKSVLASAIAVEAVRAGKKVLLAELGEKSFYRDFFSLPEISHDPWLSQEGVSKGLHFALWSGESSLREYVLHYLKIEKLYKAFFQNRVMRALVNIAPGLADIAIIGKITSGIRKVGPPMDFDLIVVDCYATGHARALFRAPRGMAEAIPMGPMGAQSRDIEKVLRDPSLSSHWLVCLPEELPVAETLEFAAELKADLGVQVGVIMNKVYISTLTPEELTQAEMDLPPEHPLVEFAKHLTQQRIRQQKYIDDIRVLDPDPVIVPLFIATENVNDPQVLLRKVGEAIRNV